MSGLLRNLLTLLAAWPRRGSAAPDARVSAWFHVTPLDTGIATLKSDRYLQIAEAAQLDYLLQTGLMGRILKNRWQFVNASQLVKFMRPVRMFDRIRVDSQVVYADAKCAWFRHSFVVHDATHAEVLVKMKFKSGPVTVAPSEVLGAFTGGKPAGLQQWDETLDAL